MRLTFLLACAAFLGLWACEPGSAQTCPPGKTCIRAGNLADPGTLDPAHTWIKEEQTVLDDLMLGLTTFDAEGRPVPGAAESWSVSVDGLVWTFRLRPATWSDGAPVTADDFVFSLRRLVAPATGAAYAVLAFPVVNAEAVNKGRAPAEALGIRALDPRTVQIRLWHPTPSLPTLLAHYGVLPVPAHAVRKWGERWSTPGRYVSNGPYRLVSWRLGDRIVLEKNPRFYDAARVCVDRVEYFPTSDIISAERRVRRGELDMNFPIDSTRVKYLRTTGMNAFIHVAPWTDVNYLVFNLKDRIMRDERVRRALAMAIDRDFIALRLLGAGQEPTAALTPPAVGGLPAAPDWALPPLRIRQARARALLAQAGYGPAHPLKFELRVPMTGLGIFIAVQSDWRDIGVETTLAREDVAVYFNDLQRGDFQVGFTDYIADYPDPQNFLDSLRSDRGSVNYGSYANAAYDRLLDQAQQELDHGHRLRLLQAAEQLMLAEAPIAPLYVNPSLNLVNPAITGWSPNINDVHPMRWICRRSEARADLGRAPAGRSPRGSAAPG